MISRAATRQARVYAWKHGVHDIDARLPNMGQYIYKVSKEKSKRSLAPPENPETLRWGRRKPAENHF